MCNDDVLQPCLKLYFEHGFKFKYNKINNLHQIQNKLQFPINGILAYIF